MTDIRADIEAAGAFRLGDRTVNRTGYGAMQLAGPGVLAPPKDRNAALAVLRAAISSGVDHIDTSDYYGPHITNQLICEALHPYPAGLTIVTKLGAVPRAGRLLESGDPRRRTSNAPSTTICAISAWDALDVVNLRLMGRVHGPSEGSLEAPFTALAELKSRGLIRHLGLSNVTSAQVAEARGIAEVVCVQNMYNVVHRDDDALIDELADQGIAYVPFSRSAASRRCSPRPSRKSRAKSARRQCRRRSPGSSNARPIFFSSPAPPRPATCARTSRRPRSSCRTKRWPDSTRSAKRRVIEGARLSLRGIKGRRVAPLRRRPLSAT